MKPDPDFHPEEYLLQKLAENFDYIKNKNVKIVTLCSQWSAELRKNNYNYTVSWVRKWVSDIMRLLKKGTIPSFVTSEDLMETAKQLVEKAPSLQDAKASVLSAPYSDTEHEHLLFRLAERIAEVSSPVKGSRKQFVTDMLNELAKLGFNRSQRSIESWIANVRKGKFPKVLQQPNLAIANEVITSAFGPSAKVGQNDDCANAEDTTDLFNFTDNFACMNAKLHEMVEPFKSEIDSESDGDASCEKGSELSTKYTGTELQDTLPMNLRALLDAEQSLEVINCAPFWKEISQFAMPDASMKSDSDCTEDNSKFAEMSNGDVLRELQKKKTELLSARKRKRKLDREVDGIREQLRLSFTKALMETTQVYYLEEQLKELKEYIENTDS